MTHLNLQKLQKGDITVVARSKAINYLVAATVERHDRNSGRRPVESGPFSFILRARLAYDVSTNLELALASTPMLARLL